MSAADARLNWRESADPRKECCQFDFNGRRYIAHRAVTNRGGVQYWPLSMKGEAARSVLDFMRAHQ